MEAVDKSSEKEPDRERVAALSRGLAVIEAFASERRALTITDVANLTAIPKAAARRILRTLVDLGYATTDGRLFDLTPRILKLGFGYLASRPLGQATLPVMEKLRDRLDVPSSMSVLDQHEIVMIARVPTLGLLPSVPTLGAVSIPKEIGSRLPAFCTSMGRVLLAYASEDMIDRALHGPHVAQYTPYTDIDVGSLREKIRQIPIVGYALVQQEALYWLSSLAVPIFDSTGNILAAMSISAPSALLSAQEMLDRYLGPLLEAQAEIRQAIPGPPRRGARSSPSASGSQTFS